MTMKYLPLVATLAIASPAFGITVNMTDFTFTPPGAVAVTDSSDASNNFGGLAGEFDGTFVGTSNLRVGSPEAASSASFNAYCAEISQGFGFGIPYDYTLVSGAGYFGATKASNLSRLFRAAEGFVIDGTTSAALQAAIWEIIYEKAPTFSLAAGNFTGTGDAAAFGTVNSFLTNLSSYSDAFYKIEVLTNGIQQDFVVPTLVPEPGTWALLAAGLGAIGLVARRRKA